jgi:SAM-dependent methyltransferase
MNSARPSCHVCGSSSAVEIATLAHGVTSDCKPSPFPVELFECPDCGVVQTAVSSAWRLRTAAIYDAYECYAAAGGLEQKVTSTEGLKSRSIVLLDWLAATGVVPERGDLLEIGCGLGGFLRAFSGKFPFWRLDAVEWDARALGALEKIPGFRSLHTGGWESVSGRFGFFTMVHALEHFENPVRVLSSLRAKANPGALLLVQVMSWIENPFDLAVADHATHFSPQTLESVARAAGWEPVYPVATPVAKELTLLARAAGSAPLAREITPGVLMSRLDWLASLASCVRPLADSSPRFGLFGTALAATWLAESAGEKLAFFVDGDPARIGRIHLGKPILAPEAVPAEADVFIGMAPSVSAKLAGKYRNLPARFHAAPPLPSP